MAGVKGETNRSVASILRKVASVRWCQRRMRSGEGSSHRVCRAAWYCCSEELGGCHTVRILNV